MSVAPHAPTNHHLKAKDTHQKRHKYAEQIHKYATTQIFKYAAEVHKYINTIHTQMAHHRKEEESLHILFCKRNHLAVCTFSLVFLGTKYNAVLETNTGEYNKNTAM